MVMKDALRALHRAPIEARLSHYFKDFGILPEANVSWNMRGTSLLQTDASGCNEYQACYAEQMHLIVLLLVLVSMIASMVVAFAFFREDKEDQINPLTPQFLVRESEFTATMTLDPEAESIPIYDKKGDIMAQAGFEWADPFRPSSSCGVTCTVRVRSGFDVTLALIQARNLTLNGQSLALCRAAHDPFAFIEVDGNKYHVRHRTAQPLLSLVGEFCADLEGVIELEGYNQVGYKICSLKKEAGSNACKIWVTQYIDAGLVICSALGIHLQHRLAAQPSPRMAALTQPEAEISLMPRQAESPEISSSEPEPADEGVEPGAPAARADGEEQSQ